MAAWLSYQAVMQNPLGNNEAKIDYEIT